MSNFAYSLDETLHLCDEVYKKNKGKFWSFSYWWCLGCRKFSKPDTARCFNIEDGTNTGCPQINRLYKILHGVNVPNKRY